MTCLNKSHDIVLPHFKWRKCMRSYWNGTTHCVHYHCLANIKSKKNNHSKIYQTVKMSSFYTYKHDFLLNNEKHENLKMPYILF